MIEEYIVWIIGGGLLFVVGLCLGFTGLNTETSSALVKVSDWIDATTSNKWVQYEMYQDLEEKYDALLREYEQYRGTMKAIDDCCKKSNNGDVE